MNETPNKSLQQQLKDTLDASLDTIDPHVQRELQIARANVLEKAGKTTLHSSRWYTWASLASVASVAVLGFYLLVSVNGIDPANTGLTSNFDVNLFDDETSIEIFEEYDFYVWLSQQDANT